MVDVNITIRDTEGSEAQPYLVWDTIWNADEQCLDWAICSIGDPVEPQNGGGLQSRVPLDTAIRICLATWRRAEPFDVLPSGNDPQGWWGDSIQLDDDLGPLGSRLWLLYRSALTDTVAAQAVTYAREALTCLLTQGVVVRFDITSRIDKKPKEKLSLRIKGYSQDGAKVYEQEFSKIWDLEFASLANRIGGADVF